MTIVRAAVLIGMLVFTQFTQAADWAIENPTPDEIYELPFENSVFVNAEGTIHFQHSMCDLKLQQESTTNPGTWITIYNNHEPDMIDWPDWYHQYQIDNIGNYKLILMNEQGVEQESVEFEVKDEFPW